MSGHSIDGSTGSSDTGARGGGGRYDTPRYDGGQITMPTYDSEYWRQQRQMATELGEPFAEPFPRAPASMTGAAASLPDDVREKLEALKCAEERVRAQNRRIEEESNPLPVRKGWRQPRKRRKQL
jgi:hypothetical protein